MKALLLPLAGTSARSCELPLPPEVRRAFDHWLPAKWSKAVEKRKAQSLGARWCAVEAARELGVTLSEIRLDDAGMPLWPAGMVGSLAHTDACAVAVLSLAHRCIGVDVEELFDEKKCELLRATILTARELRNLSTDPAQQCRELTAIFGLKEAAYKALFPELRVFIDFPQLDVDLTHLRVTHESGRVLEGHLVYEGINVISVAYN